MFGQPFIFHAPLSHVFSWRFPGSNALTNYDGPYWTMTNHDEPDQIIRRRYTVYLNINYCTVNLMILYIWLYTIYIHTLYIYILYIYIYMSVCVCLLHLLTWDPMMSGGSGPSDSSPWCCCCSSPTSSVWPLCSSVVARCWSRSSSARWARPFGPCPLLETYGLNMT